MNNFEVGDTVTIINLDYLDNCPKKYLNKIGRIVQIQYNPMILCVDFNEDYREVSPAFKPYVHFYPYNLKLIKEESVFKMEENKNYYLSIDFSMEGNNRAVLMEEYNNELKLIKFIKIHTNKLNDIADRLIEEIKSYKNGKIIIPTIAIGYSIVDYLKQKGFNNILELDLDDIRICCKENFKLIQNKDKIYKLFKDDYSKFEIVELIELYKELNNMDLEYYTGGVKFKRKSLDIDSTRVCCILYALSKLGYAL